jgi:hypothetical protein
MNDSRNDSVSILPVILVDAVPVGPVGCKDGNGHELSAYPRVKNRWVWVWVPFYIRGYGYR